MPKFITQNTALAAYLITEGFELLEALVEQNPVSFIFEDCNSLRGCVRCWQAGKAEGNLCIFFDNYRTLIKKIHLYEVKI